MNRARSRPPLAILLAAVATVVFLIVGRSIELPRRLIFAAIWFVVFWAWFTFLLRGLARRSP